MQLPENIETLNVGDAFVLRRTWFTKRAYFMLFFSICWNGFMVVWMTLAIADGAWLMALFGSLHAGVGLWLIYYTSATFLNTTDISISPDTVSIQHFPLPWFKPKPIPIFSITHIYTKQHLIQGESGDEITYRVLVKTKDNKTHKLVTGLQDNTLADFIKTEIEVILGLEGQNEKQ